MLWRVSDVITNVVMCTMWTIGIQTSRHHSSRNLGKGLKNSLWYWSMPHVSVLNKSHLKRSKWSSPVGGTECSCVRGHSLTPRYETASRADNEGHISSSILHRNRIKLLLSFSKLFYRTLRSKERQLRMLLRVLTTKWETCLYCQHMKIVRK